MNNPNKTVYQLLKEVECEIENPESSSKDDTEDKTTTLQKLSSINEMIQAMGMFSPNEELIDISTRNIPFLSISFYQAKCYSQVTELDRRLVALKVSQTKYQEFLNQCQNYNLLNQEDMILYDAMDNVVRLCVCMKKNILLLMFKIRMNQLIKENKEKSKSHTLDNSRR